MTLPRIDPTPEAKKLAEQLEVAWPHECLACESIAEENHNDDPFDVELCDTCQLLTNLSAEIIDKALASARARDQQRHAELMQERDTFQLASAQNGARWAESQQRIAELEAERDEAQRVVRFAHLFQRAARDESLSDAEVRNIVGVLSLRPITEADIQRAQELAAEHGWDLDKSEYSASTPINSKPL